MRTKPKVGDPQEIPGLVTSPLFAMRLAVDPIVTIGGPLGAARRIGTIPGGSFEGSRLQGTVLPGGSDWQIERGDGALMLDGRIVLRTQDEALVAMTYTGIRHGPADIMARLGRGEPVAASAYCFRITPSFSTSDARYLWLNTIIAIGVGIRTAEGPIYQIRDVA